MFFFQRILRFFSWISVSLKEVSPILSQWISGFNVSVVLIFFMHMYISSFFLMTWSCSWQLSSDSTRLGSSVFWGSEGTSADAHTTHTHTHTHQRSSNHTHAGRAEQMVGPRLIVTPLLWEQQGMSKGVNCFKECLKWSNLHNLRKTCQEHIQVIFHPLKHMF